MFKFQAWAEWRCQVDYSWLTLYGKEVWDIVVVGNCLEAKQVETVKIILDHVGPKTPADIFQLKIRA